MKKKKSSCDTPFPWMGFPGSSVGKNLHAMQELQEISVRSLGQEDSPKKEMATHSSILAWEISWTEEPGWGVEVGATVHWVEKESDTT